MYIPDQYIKMCEKAEEIQKMRIDTTVLQKTTILIPKPLDMFVVATPLSRHVWIDLGIGENDYHVERRSIDRNGGVATIWLPSQAQLHDMVKDGYISARKMLSHFGQWCEEYGNIGHCPEQLLLAFVMKQKYDKEWHAGNNIWFYSTLEA